MLRLHVDSREKGVISNFPAQTQTQIPNIIYEQLDVGDFQFIESVESESEPEKIEKIEKILIVERKTYADLAASLRDGRYAEQKHRLQSAGFRMKAYIWEGEYPTKNINNVTPEVFDSLQYSALRDGFHIFYTKNTKHTASLLLRLQTKLHDFSPQSHTSHATALLKCSAVKKSENITPLICYQSQLMQIPGVSVIIAEAISQRWGSMSELLDHMKLNKSLELIVNNKKMAAVEQTLFSYLLPEKKKILVVKRSTDAQ